METDNLSCPLIHKRKLWVRDTLALKQSIQPQPRKCSVQGIWLTHVSSLRLLVKLQQQDLMLQQEESGHQGPSLYSVRSHLGIILENEGGAHLYAISLILPEILQVRYNIFQISQMRKSKFREVKWLARDHIASKPQDQDLNLAFLFYIILQWLIERLK